MGTELSWDAPGAGLWFLTKEHFPLPVTRFFARLFPPVTIGWATGAERYGLPGGGGDWATVNGWVYFSPPAPDPATFQRREAAAKETLATARWRGEVRQWFEVDRPRLVDANLALQKQPLRPLDEAALAKQLDRAVQHFLATAPLHFEPSGFSIAAGLAVTAAAEWGIGIDEVAPLLAGSSPGSRRPLEHLDAIVAALRDAGRTDPASLEEARAASSRACDAIDAYLEEFGWRSIDGHELTGMTLGERPDILLTSIRTHAQSDRGPAEPADPAVLRARVPAEERARFDELLADVRASYQINDDNVGVSFDWPIGLVRRVLLEVAARLKRNARIQAAAHIFEADPDEARALLTGGGPSASELAERAARTELAARADPPLQLGQPRARAALDVPPTMAHLAELRNAFWGSAGPRARESMHGLGIGDGVHRGTACVAAEIDDAFALEPGGVLIATMTTASHNAVFPIAGAVATEEGGLFGHTAVLSRELGIPAVVGAPGLLESVQTGDLVEVDARAGVVRVIERRKRAHER